MGVGWCTFSVLCIHTYTTWGFLYVLNPGDRKKNDSDDKLHSLDQDCEHNDSLIHTTWFAIITSRGWKIQFLWNNWSYCITSKLNYMTCVHGETGARVWVGVGFSARSTHTTNSHRQSEGVGWQTWWEEPCRCSQLPGVSMVCWRVSWGVDPWRNHGRDIFLLAIQSGRAHRTAPTGSGGGARISPLPPTRV